MDPPSQPPPGAPPPLPPRRPAQPVSPASQPPPPAPQPLPLPPQPLPADEVFDDIGVYRYENRLVMERDAHLPDICIKCNRPTDGKTVRRRLHISFGGSATVYLPLCAKHRERRKLFYALTWVLFLVGILLVVMSAVNANGVLGLTGALLLVPMLMFAIVASNYTGVPTRIDHDYVWIKGLNRRYMERFPQF